MKLGIVGNGGIVKMALHILKDTDIVVSSLWCRNAEKGKPLVEEYGIPSLYTDYDAFLKDDSFDTVYIGLINSLHYEYAKKAILAHKHVIVEKPFTSTYEQAKELYDLTKENNVFVFEAIMSRYSKNYQHIQKYLPCIGDIKMIQCNYSQYSSRYDAYLRHEVLPAFDPEEYGGALYDINVYNIHFVEGLFGKTVFTHYEANIGFNGVDTSGTLIMRYPEYIAVCTGAKDSASHNGVMIQGTKGYIQMDSRPGIIQNLTLHLKDEVINIDVEEMQSPMKTEFEQIASIIEEKDTSTMVLWLENSLEVMKILSNSRKEIGL